MIGLWVILACMYVVHIFTRMVFAKLAHSQTMAAASKIQSIVRMRLAQSSNNAPSRFVGTLEIVVYDPTWTLVAAILLWYAQNYSSSMGRGVENDEKSQPEYDNACMNAEEWFMNAAEQGVGPGLREIMKVLCAQDDSCSEKKKRGDSIPVSSSNETHTASTRKTCFGRRYGNFGKRYGKKYRRRCQKRGRRRTTQEKREKRPRRHWTEQRYSNEYTTRMGAGLKIPKWLTRREQERMRRPEEREEREEKTQALDVEEPVITVKQLLAEVLELNSDISQRAINVWMDEYIGDIKMVPEGRVRDAKEKLSIINAKLRKDADSEGTFKANRARAKVYVRTSKDKTNCEFFKSSLYQRLVGKPTMKTVLSEINVGHSYVMRLLRSKRKRGYVDIFTTSTDSNGEVIVVKLSGIFDRSKKQKSEAYCKARDYIAMHQLLLTFPAHYYTDSVVFPDRTQVEASTTTRINFIKARRRIGPFLFRRNLMIPVMDKYPLRFNDSSDKSPNTVIGLIREEKIHGLEVMTKLNLEQSIEDWELENQIDCVFFSKRKIDKISHENLMMMEKLIGPLMRTEAREAKFCMITYEEFEIKSRCAECELMAINCYYQVTDFNWGKFDIKYKRAVQYSRDIHKGLKAVYVQSCDEKRALVNIQSATRLTKLKATLIAVREAARKIQSRARSAQRKACFDEKKRAVVKLQSTVRTTLSVIKFAITKKSVVQIQRFARTVQAKTKGSISKKMPTAIVHKEKPQLLLKKSKLEATINASEETPGWL